VAGPVLITYAQLGIADFTFAYTTAAHRLA